MTTNPEPEPIPVDLPDTPTEDNCGAGVPPAHSDKPTGFLGRAANRIGEAIDDVQQTIGLQANEPQGACVPCPPPTPPRKPIEDLLLGVVNAVTKVQEETKRALSVKVTVRDNGYDQGCELEFTL